MWIAIAPLALLLVVFATVIPAEFRSPRLGLVSWSFNPRDFILNVLLFFPLGLALATRRWFVLAAILVGSSLAIEIIQLGQAGRHAGISDLFANVLGGLLGALRWPEGSKHVHINAGYIGMDRSIFLATALVGGAIPLLLIALPSEPLDFSNWDPSHRLAMGDEFTRDRSWKGSLAAWKIYDRALPQHAIRELADRSIAKGDRVEQDAATSNLVESWQNPTPAAPIGFAEIPPQETSRIYRRLTDTNEMSVLAWIKLNDVDQDEDGRVITLSHDQYSRNFSITQHGGTLGFRLRTPTSGLNGTEPQLVTDSILHPGQNYFVAVTYDGGVSRIYVDGELVGRKSLATSGSFLPIGDESTLPLALAVSGGCFAALVLVLAPHSWRRRRWALVCLCGIGVAGIAWHVQDWPLEPIFNPLRRVIPPLVGGVRRCHEHNKSILADRQRGNGLGGLGFPSSPTEHG